MKRLVALCVFASLLPLHGAEEGRLKEVMERRVALLVEIHKGLKLQFKAGSASSNEVWAAAQELYKLRRTMAKSRAEQIKWQEELLALTKREQEDAKARAAIGVAMPIEIDLAEERVLATEQKLLELQLAK